MQVRAKQLVAAMKRLGFREVRQKGSHLQLKRANVTVPVPMHAGDLPQGTLHSILRRAHLTMQDLKEAL